MITRADAEAVAAGWARREGIRGGYPCEPIVDEFDLGYVVYTSRPLSVRSEPGAFPKSVIDKETGRMSTWPSVPSAVVQKMYRERRATVVDPPRSADQEVQLRREAARRMTPSVAAHITLDGRIFIARGAKGDQVVRHHHVVARWLAAKPIGTRVRGIERHAELLAVSDVLHEVDRVRAQHGYGPVTHDEARAMLRAARLETFHIRESGDPLGGKAAQPCANCIELLVEVGLLPYEKIARTEPWAADMYGTVDTPVSEADPHGRFPEAVASALLASRWKPHLTDLHGNIVDRMMTEAEEVKGLEHELIRFPAAKAFLVDFYGVITSLRGPGERHRIQQFEVDPLQPAWSADMLAEFGALIGARLYPVGVEKELSMLAVDEQGRVFAFDQAGEWFLGASGDAAIVTLITGGPVSRVKDDGTW
jgi:hypothetical protein